MQTYLLMGIFLLAYVTVAVAGLRKRIEKSPYFSVDDTNVLKSMVSGTK
ncbi:MAG: hypothetical protein LUI87_04885 [Lachnospiraceae bacterium]|nr:hypothetical protein [Lachnospiraceae bacterium]